MKTNIIGENNMIARDSTCAIIDELKWNSL